MANVQKDGTLFGDAPFSMSVLHYLEEDLTIDEKVSLVFLLYDDVPVAQERLFISLKAYSESRSHRVSSSLLHDWAVKTGNYWKEKLVEGLLIIKAYSNIRKLLLDVEKLKTHFLSDCDYTSLFVHPVRKVIYKICDSSKVNETNNLILHIQRDCHEKNNLNSIVSFDIQYSELFFLKLIQSGYIKVGTWKNDVIEKSDVSNLVNILKRLNCGRFVSLLESSQNYVNLTLEKNIKCQSQVPRSSKADLTECDVNDRRQDNTEFKSSRQSQSKSKDHPQDPSRESLLDNTYIYPVHNPSNMGFVVIINQEKFQNRAEPQLTANLNERDGSQLDEKRLIKTWTDFGFDPIVKNNLKYDDILMEISFIASNMVLENHSAFVLCILSHGKNGVIMSSEGKSVSVEVIQELFNVSQAPHLAGKPKIIILQSCQGEDKMLAVKPVKSASNSIEKLLVHDGPQNKDTLHTYPEKSDMFTFWSTVPGYVSYRDPQEGTWFIQTLCEQMDNVKSESEDFIKICLRVISSISNKRENCCYAQMPEFTTSFTKSFFIKRVQ